MKGGFIVATICLFVVCSSIGCTPSENPRHIYENGAIAVGADGEPIELFNNPGSRNPTYAELIAFIRTDDTDAEKYLEESLLGWEPFVCADFAEAVHNNAEGAGIRAAWVSIDFTGEEVGHALNAFETTDKGLVYIDCTGAPWMLFQQGVQPSRDALAYVEVGKEYALIPLDTAKSLSYSFYEQYKKRWHDFDRLLTEYNSEVMKFNEESKVKLIIIGSPAWERITSWEARLKAQEKELDKLSEGLSSFWLESPGIVENLHIHWGKE